MKTIIEPVTGIVSAGHMALRIDGACIITAPDDRANKLESHHLIKIKSKLGAGDRMVSASTFAQATGCTIFRAGKIYKPAPIAKKKIGHEVLSLLK
jgi:hypothetical protein